MMKLITSLFAFGALWATGFAHESANDKKPNFIVILTDDQDLRMNSLDYMPGVKHYLTDQGTFFDSHYATVALCCPSRASMWTGKAAHNTNITGLKPPYGGYPKFINEGYNKKWLPVWMKKAGYKTYFIGKLMNGHSTENYKYGLGDMYLDGHDFFIEPGTYQYTNTTVQHNMDKPKNHPGVYATDLLANKSIGWIEDAVKSDSSFFLAINPVNPHNNYEYNKNTWTPPVPAERYKNEFPDAIVPRNISFNPDRPSGASWVRELEKLSDKQVKNNDIYYRRRLQALLAVDDMVNRTVARLDELKILDNTYIIYTSDNGFHIGQHRLTPGKRCPYEEDVNVPLIIRGPGVPKGKTVDFVTSHTDIAPTIVNWAGAKGPGDFDGAVIPINATEGTDEPWEHVQIEHWGMVSDKYKSKHGDKYNTYKAMRIIGENYNLYYSVWCEGDHEVYDMSVDPFQMSNLYTNSSSGSNSTQILGVSMNKLQNRFDAVLQVLKTCKSHTCRRPWEALHPNGDVLTLVQALDPKYDSFYESQTKVTWTKCDAGYSIENELPISYMVYGNHTSSLDL